MTQSFFTRKKVAEKIRAPSVFSKNFKENNRPNWRKFAHAGHPARQTLWEAI
jgi:hypothetical protein